MMFRATPQFLPTPMNRKRPTSIHEIVSKSSASTQRLNARPRSKVSRPRVRFAAAARALAAATPDPKPEPVSWKTLGHRPELAPLLPDGAPLRPRVTFTLFRVGLLDGDNKFASVKFLLDALRYAKLLRDDRELDIELVVHQQKVGRYDLEGTGITIDYP